MLKKLLMLIAAGVLVVGNAFAGVDVNKGDQAALDGIKGLGPVKSKAILEERKKNGDFKDWADFEKRVKGIGEKSAAKLSEAGLTINGAARTASPVTPAAKSEAKSEVKTEAKADVKAAAASVSASATEKKKK